MYKIAAFITFNKKIEQKILSQKNKVKKKFGHQMYLDHPVHLTLFTITINKITILKTLYKNLKKNLKENKLTIKINKSGAFINDPLTNGHTLYYGIKNNKSLSNAQIKHLKIINKKLSVFKKNIYLFKNKTLKNNYKKYGFPFAGKIWIPHITVASIKDITKDHIFIKRFLKSKINLEYTAKDIKFYIVNNEKHDFLFKTNLF